MANKEIFKPWTYYRSKKTGRVYSIRYMDNLTIKAVQCFARTAKDCEILYLGELIHKDMEFYAKSFPDAFNRYWRENRVKLILQNKAEMKGMKLPSNMTFEKWTL